jgi:cell division protein FtsI (penicillin-binding protein 3)
MNRRTEHTIAPGRRRLFAGVCALAALLLAGRAVDLQVVRSEFLQDQGAVRHVRTVPVAAHRGMILDRHGEPLAISTPLASIWADPGPLSQAPERWSELAAALDIPAERVASRVREAEGKQFIWLRRRVTPDRAEEVLALDVPGVGKRREYRRYYPTAEVSGQVLGFTDIDDHGQEGLELAYDDWLSGQPGRKRVVQDRLGRVVEDLELIEAAHDGKDLRISLDRRLQYLAYRELKAAVQRHEARAGSLVMLDVHTGEVLAMVNQPSFNPNDPGDRAGSRVRNRAVTDVFEPGSAMKPLTVAAALEAGAVEPGTPVSTAPGWLHLKGHTIKDYKDLGRLDVAGVVRKSSNVGVSRIALQLDPREMWSTFADFDLGVPTGSGFPGERGGHLQPPSGWGDLEQATMAFGYGVSVTALQLARAYAAIAADGVMPPARFRPLGEDEPVDARRVLSQRTAGDLQAMLQSAASPEGTGGRAEIAGYRVAGKTGTAHKSVAGGYARDRYRAVFAGFAPAADPRIAAVVMIDEPEGEAYYGGQIAAPVFARVMAGAMRLLDIRPDADEEGLLAARGGDR